ncbi:MAG: hypothetical protein KAR21_23475, partial [Spirochaetales bacterium]|nr:hypothetical protein [Spirochaetales bacterium]
VDDEKDVLKVNEILLKRNGYRYEKAGSGRAALDALTTKRCYRDTISFKNAKGIITSDSGTHFSSEVVKAFSSITEHELSNREVVYVR